MPIKGLTEQMTLPRLGKIRLGIMKENEKGKKYPSETEYFVVPEEVQAVYGPEPTELDVVFPVDDPGMVFGQWYKWYGSDQGLKCRGDGETAMRRYDLVDDKDAIDEPPADEHDSVEISCPCHRLNNKEDSKNCCTPKGNLMVILPKINRFAVYQIDVSSPSSIRNINSMIAILQAQLGRISMIPLILRRVPTEMTTQGHKRTHYLLQLECRLNDQQVEHIQLHPAAPALMLEQSAKDELDDVFGPETPLSEPVPEDVEAMDAAEAGMNRQFEDEPPTQPEQAFDKELAICHILDAAGKLISATQPGVGAKAVVEVMNGHDFRFVPGEIEDGEILEWVLKGRLDNRQTAEAIFRELVKRTPQHAIHEMPENEVS